MCTSCCEYVPFQIYPVVEKKIIWSHPLDNYIFMLQKDFAEQLLDPIRTGGPFQGKLFYLMDTAPEPDSDRGPLTPVSASASPVPRKRVPGRVQQHPSKNPNRVEVTVKADRQTSLLRLENYH
ncbi:MAG: hypothetical protein GWM98_11350, partial [Nitrospinaceae bacterium]|nr:hypothetical protein [Nitrospinaceae bacterium]NIX34612.1 hypothetical protein [Nitrospinaceae bacterium]NIY15442.1 hypothetical protein [Nitrospinaceae bacterium]